MCLVITHFVILSYKTRYYSIITKQVVISRLDLRHKFTKCLIRLFFFYKKNQADQLNLTRDQTF